MKNIGVILPYIKSSDNFVKEFFKRFVYQKFPVTEYGFNFLVAHDNQNCSKIFNKHKINKIVVLTDCEIESCNFQILTGDRIYKQMLPEYIRKTAKKYGGNCSVTLVDKNLSADGILIADKLCTMCRTVNINTRSVHSAESLCDKLLDKYGIAVSVVGNDDVINTDIVVVIEDCGNKYGQNCLIIDKYSKIKSNRIINDFYIPFRVKPPFGMSNLLFAECIDAINK